MTATYHLPLLALAFIIGAWGLPLPLDADIALNGAAPPSETPRAARSSAENGSSSQDASTASETASSATAAPHKTSHHRRKKGSSSTTSTGSGAATPSSAGTASNAKTAGKKSGATPTIGGASSANLPVANAEAAGKAAATQGAVAQSGAVKPTTGRRKKHSKTTAATAASQNSMTGEKPSLNAAAASTPAPSASRGAPTSAPSSLPATTSTPLAGGTTAIAPAVAKSAVAKSSRRKRHGKTSTTTTTEATSASGQTAGAAGASTHPNIVITPATGPLTKESLPVAPSSANLAPNSGIGLGPTVQTGLPVARPGAGTTATLPVDLEHHVHAGETISGSSLTPTEKFPFTDYPPLPEPKKVTHTYPWKRDIITTVFWIGEGDSPLSQTTNYQSAWNMNWIHDNGGSDDQDDMSGYASSLHASTLNPFYIALPFNDLVYPEKARRWVPSYWFRPPKNGKPVSACQDRWVEIKGPTGRTCYAQWEDVGPLRYDHAEYVFGDERPDTLTRAGLDISPAVAKYLGINTHGAARTSWRFVDPDDVQPGMWLKYDEQAIIFRALEEQARHGTSPIQDMEEPTPDANSQEANQKRAGAARG